MKLNILEGTKVYDQTGSSLGMLDLQEGCRSEVMIIIESAEFSDLREVEITEEDGAGAAAIREDENPHILLALDGRFQHADLHNANKRMYPDTLWDKLLTLDGKWMKRVRESKMLGECDHPKDGQTLLSRVSHLITRLYRNPNNPKEIRGRLLVFDTPAGRILKAIHEGGGKIGVSSRGKGSVVRRDGFDIVQEDFDLDTFDAVYNPSTPDAYPHVVSESTQDGQENTEMNKRLQDLSERLARHQKRDVAQLAGAAVDVISEEVESITQALTTESFGEEAPKAAVLAVDARDFSRSLKSRKKQLTEEADDILGEPGKTAIPGGDGSEPKKNWMGLAKGLRDGDAKEDKKEAADSKVDPDALLAEPGFVHGAADEELWDKAKRAAKHAGADNQYAFANWFFHKQKGESVTVEGIVRPTTRDSILRSLEALTPENLRMNESVGDTDTAKAVSQAYRSFYKIEGKLTEVEAATVTEHVKNLGTKKAKLEETAKVPLKAKITIDGNIEEVTAPSEAELRRLVEGRIEGRDKDIAYVEIDRSDNIIKECADRFNLLLESQTLRTVLATQATAKAKAELGEVSVKVAGAQQIIEALVSRVRSAEANLSEVQADFNAAVEILEAVAEEIKAERLRGVVEGIAATNPTVDELPQRLSEATSPAHAVQIAKTLIESSEAVLREALPANREAQLTEALNANDDAAEERRQKESKPFAPAKLQASTGQGAIQERTKMIVGRVKALGGK